MIILYEKNLNFLQCLFDDFIRDEHDGFLS